jgi:L-ascorbate metabolism protein UlaG (beta-lactamase superfamily)
MFPEETALAAVDLKARTLMPVHWAKFTLSLHPWNESIRRLAAEAKELGQAITTPEIGEPVNINRDYPIDPWYEPNRMESGSKT